MIAQAQFLRQNENRIPKKAVNMDLKRKYLRGRPRSRWGLGKKRLCRRKTWDDTEDKLWEDLCRQSLGRAHTISETWM